MINKPLFKSFTILAFLFSAAPCLTASASSPSEPTTAAQQLVLTSSAKTPTTLRLLYWNIQNGMWDGQTDDYKRFTDWVAAQDPDICVWCEGQKNYATNSASAERETEAECLSRWKRLAARYGHTNIYLSAHRDNYPQVITSKYPVEVIKRLTGQPSDTIVAHGASWSVLKIAKKRINIVTLHTWPQSYAYGIPTSDRQASTKRHGGDSTRTVELQYICNNTILTHPDAKDELWMMMGDFNARSPLDNDTYKLDENSSVFWVHNYILAHTPYVDIVKKQYPSTFLTTTGHKSRIDFIYATAPLYQLVKNVQVISDSYTTPVRDPQNLSNFWHPSDHRPIIVDFMLK